MVNCCVPLCTSRQTDPNMSFHEIPVNEDQRVLWVKNISRKDWIPKESDRVCGKHFVWPDDYKTGLKVKKLRSDSVPSLFPNYPAHMQRNAKKVAISLRSPAVQKLPVQKSPPVQKMPSAQKSSPIQKPLIVLKSPLEQPSVQIVRQANKVDGQKTIFIIKKSIVPADEGAYERVIKTVMSKAQQATPRKRLKVTDPTIEIEIPAPPLPPKKAPVPVVKVNKSVPTSKHSGAPHMDSVTVVSSATPLAPKQITPNETVISPKQKVASNKPLITAKTYPSFQLSAEFLQIQALNKKVRAAQSRFRRLQKRHQDMKSRMAKLEDETASLRSATLASSVSKITEKAKEGNTLALFLRQQIQAFGKKRVLWHEDVLKHCKAWRNRLPLGYEYVREARLLKLPSRTTLEREAGDIPGDKEVTGTSTTMANAVTEMEICGTTMEVGDVTLIQEQCGTTDISDAPTFEVVSEIPIQQETTDGDGCVEQFAEVVSVVPFEHHLAAGDIGDGSLTEVVIVATLEKEIGDGDGCSETLTELITFVPIEKELVADVSSAEVVSVAPLETEISESEIGNM